MGYRSDGALWLSKDAKLELTDELKDELDDWDYDDTNDIYTFEGWKWYDRYPDVDIWINFMKHLSNNEIDYDFIRIGEAFEDVDIHSHKKFYLNLSIGIY